MVTGLGCMVPGLGCMVHGSGFRIKGVGFGICGLGFGGSKALRRAATHDVDDRYGKVWVRETPKHRHGCPRHLSTISGFQSKVAGCPMPGGWRQRVWCADGRGR